jgi:pimeloyl-ACP methyl ester carboxylesterase
MVVTELAPEPPLPRGERIELAGRGTTFVRTVAGPPGAPTVLLLHGWIASGGLNWFTSFAPLSQRYNVIAPDMRGHGRGIRSRRRFRLADCADDMAALLEHLDTGPAIAVGYSMGGPIAQLLWRRHPESVAALVATAVGTTRAGHLLSRAPVSSMRRWGWQGSGTPPTNMRAWAAGEMRRHDTVKIMEAGQAIGSYNAQRWIGEVDVPTTVLVTQRDRAIAPREQLKLAAAIPGAVVQTIDDGHVACAKREFGPALVRAVDAAWARVDQTPARRAAAR